MSEGQVYDWRIFRDLSPILTARGASLKLKGKYTVYLLGVNDIWK
jgi:hypothetical protein